MRESFEPQRGDLFCVELPGFGKPSFHLVLEVEHPESANIKLKLFSFEDNSIESAYWDWNSYPDLRRITLLSRLTDQ